MRPTINVWATGTKDGGGSGFENLVKHSRDPNGDLKADIVGVISDIENGGVQKRAERLNIPFYHFAKERQSPDSYRRLAKKSGGDWNAFSGWLNLMWELPMETSFNIHPARLVVRRPDNTPRFGGHRMHGHHVHEEVKRAIDVREIPSESGFTMHFMDEVFDHGPIICDCRVEIPRSYTADDIGRLVNKAEHKWQPKITNMIVNRVVRLVGDQVLVPGGGLYLKINESRLHVE